MIYWLLTPFILLLLAWPYMLFLEARRLDTPVKAFAYRFGREDISILLTLLLYNGAAAFALYMAFTKIIPLESAQEGVSLKVQFVFCLIVMPWLAIAFIVNRLHYSYWRQDRHTRLEVDKLQQRVVYTNQDQQLTFAVSEVVSIVQYSARYYSRAPWNAYEYEVYTLQDGTEIIITCLLYYSTSPTALFPAAQRETVRRRICWLPKSRSLNHTSLIQNS
ncbi:hypothetical protein AUC43_06045 [Hymenobacter sedentarius]|uniref:PH domain-containing protein n=1 Tax=Hymenobacter sedentarius TaxID=1411621 RepID=A0A0U4AMF5_9BACT|nr:hypothetical protein [Hymenobacter sedentarius]ALW84677.1 hypothetical protein AUC43_06045 [Hymenobacter sedentarius]